MCFRCFPNGKVPVNTYSADQSTVADWPDLEGWQLEYLNDAVPLASKRIDIETLRQKFPRHNTAKPPCSWIEHMHDQELSALHILKDLITQGSFGRWHLFRRLAKYDQPWVTLEWDDMCKEYPAWDNDGARTCPAWLYVKHMCKRYEGEVVLAWHKWICKEEPLPRDKLLWREQFATKPKQASALRELQQSADGNGTLFSDFVDLATIGNTNIMMTRERNPGHHQQIEGGAITLAELFLKFGDSCCAKELLFWYTHAPKICRKRAHPVGSQDVRDASKLRFKATGHYGHQRHGRYGRYMGDLAKYCEVTYYHF
jgi:hypothetical protein